MIVCEACGTSNADDERFCGQCGAFLEWKGAVVDRGAGGATTGAMDPVAPVAAAGSSHADSGAEVSAGGAGVPAGTVDVADRESAATAASGTASAEDKPSVEPEPTATTAAKQPAAAKPTPVKPAGKPTPVKPAATAAQGASPVSATAESTVVAATQTGVAGPTEVKPGASTEVKPGAPQRPRPVPQRPEMDREPAKPGDLICGKCGTGNDPIRRFCRYCGGLLAEAKPAHVPWWLRLWRWLTRRRNRYEAGQRRQSRIRPRLAQATRLLALVLVVALGIGFGPALVRRAVNEVRDRTGAHVPITPNGFTASSVRGDAVAQRIGDGASNRYWAPEGAGTDAWVEASFSQPVRLLDVVVTPGISLSKEEFLTAGRPRELVVLATPQSGKAKTFTLNLKDAPGAQTFSVEAEKVLRVRITVRSAYGPADTAGVGIAEVEFFGRQ